MNYARIIHRAQKNLVYNLDVAFDAVEIFADNRVVVAFEKLCNFLGFPFPDFHN